MIIEIHDDFDLDRIAESGQCFRWERTEAGWRIPHLGSCLYISPASGTSYALDCSRDEFEALWRPYFDLETDYRSIRSRIDPNNDPFLARAAREGLGIRILRQDPWETLVSFIISQNRNIPAIRRSVGLLCRAAGEERRDGRGEAYYGFPSPGAVLALSDAELDSCRLGYRSRYVRAAAKAVSSGELDLASLGKASDAEAMDALTGLYGVGIKVASCVALFGLHRLDAFPVDVWIRRALEAEYPGGYPRELYSPYNGVYQQYIFACFRNRKAEGGCSMEKQTDSILCPSSLTGSVPGNGAR